MSYGLFGTLTRESDTSLLSGAGSTVEDDVMADAAYLEASEITHESEQLAGYMAQSMNVADRLERQDLLCNELLQHPEQITTGVSAMTRESMDLAMAALGGVNKEYRPDDDSLISAPVNALEVTHEGIGSTTKKIYETIKMAFKKIWMNIKKLAAKVVVFMNNTGKKAEKLHKAFKARKSSVAKESKVDSNKAVKLIESEGWKGNLIDALKGAKVSDTLKNLATNVDLMCKIEDAADDDIKKLADAVGVAAVQARGARGAGTGKADGANQSAKVAITGTKGDVEALKKLTGASSPRYKVARAYAKLSGVGTLTTNKIKDALGEAIKSMDLPADSITIEDETVGDPVFVPFYVKGNKIFGAAYYVKQLDDDEKDNPHAFATAFKSKFGHIEGIDSDKVSTDSEKLSVMSKSNILDGLVALKGASKQLKSYSDSRLKHVEKLMKVVDTVAKANTGLTFINRIQGNDLNKRQMFSANVDISSIFAAANVFKTELKVLVTHMSYYDE